MSPAWATGDHSEVSPVLTGGYMSWPPAAPSHLHFPMISNFYASFYYAYTGISNKVCVKGRSMSSVTLLLSLVLNPLTFSQSSTQDFRLLGLRQCTKWQVPRQRHYSQQQIFDVRSCEKVLSPFHISLPEVLLFSMKRCPKIHFSEQCCSGNVSEHQLPESSRAKIPHSFQQK